MKIGLVLSGGGARGYAHIGVLKVLKEHNIKIDMIAGCSSGALVGACYAFDQNPERIERLVTRMNQLSSVIGLSFSKTSITNSNKISRYINEYLNVKNNNIISKDFSDKKNLKSNVSHIKKNLNLQINKYLGIEKKIQEINAGTEDSKKKISTGHSYEDLKIQLFVNATDINTGNDVIFSSGELLPGLLASISIPGVFSAKKIDNHLCVDGGVTNPLPISLINDKTDYMIIVDVTIARKKITEKSGILDVFTQSLALMQEKIIKEELEKLKKPYIIIKPEINDIGMFDFKEAQKSIKYGEDAAKAAIVQIENYLKNLKNISKGID